MIGSTLPLSARSLVPGLNARHLAIPETKKGT